MTRKSRILDFYASKSWAILEESLQEMYGIYKAAIERKSLDQDFDTEAVAAKLGRPLDNARTVTVRDGIAILPVSGPIFRHANLFTEISGATSIEVLATDFRTALDDRAVKSIVLEINSPGGEVDGTSELAQHIFDARGLKPIVAYVSHLGASAAYWLASACDEIVCNDTASLGSIGVVGAARISKDKNYVEFVSSQSPNKRPDPATESGKAQIQSHIDALADVFIATVARNRKMTAEEVVSQSGAGGLKVGQHAVDAGLANRVGTLEGVLADLSDPASERLKTRAENLNEKPVLQLRTDSNILKGVDNMPADNEKKPTVEEKETKPSAEAQPAKVETEKAELEAVKNKAAEAERQLGEEKTRNAELAKQSSDLQARVADLEKQARATRFAETSKGWVGNQAHHVAMLETLAQMEGGETSKLFTDYVTQQKAVAEQIATSDLLKEVGSSAPAEGSATAIVEGKAKTMSEASNGTLTFEQAILKITTEDTKLRDQYYAEQRAN
jgi:ClpP class serine protease